MTGIGIPVPTRHGWGLLIPVVPLCAAGVLTIQAVMPSADGGLSDAAAKQVQFIVLGGIGMLAAFGVGVQRLGRLAYALFALCLLLLACLIVDRWIDLPFVPFRRYARRWIEFPGVQIQPSEVMKVGYVLALAWYLRYRRNYRTLGGLIPPFALTLVPMVMILMQPDLGTVLLFLPVLFSMLFAAGAKKRHLAVIILMGLMAAPLFWLKIRDYQRLRITGVLLQSSSLRERLAQEPTWLKGRPTRWDHFRSKRFDPEAWHNELINWELETGYQLVRSKAAVGSGGLTGQGWGEGLFVEYDHLLPEKHNDFVFAMVANQWGFIGALVTLLCYLVIVVIGYDVATLTMDPFGRLVAVGLSTMFAVQTLTNVCMTVGLGPITGVTLPFVSSGGSSMIASFLSIGLLISIARYRPMLIAHRPFEFQAEAT